MSTIEDRTRKIVVVYLECEPAAVTDNAKFIDDLGADSLDNIELLMAFEEEFNIEIPDDEAADLTTFGHAVKWLTGKLEPTAT